MDNLQARIHLEDLLDPERMGDVKINAVALRCGFPQVLADSGSENIHLNGVFTKEDLRAILLWKDDPVAVASGVPSDISPASDSPVAPSTSNKPTTDQYQKDGLKGVKHSTVVTNDEQASAYLEARLWEFIDMAAAFPRAEVDERTWSQVKTYAPKTPELFYTEGAELAWARHHAKNGDLKQSIESLKKRHDYPGPVFVCLDEVLDMVKRTALEPTAWKRTIGVLAHALHQCADHAPDHTHTTTMREVSSRLMLLINADPSPVASDSDEVSIPIRSWTSVFVHADDMIVKKSKAANNSRGHSSPKVPPSSITTSKSLTNEQIDVLPFNLNFRTATMRDLAVELRRFARDVEAKVRADMVGTSKPLDMVLHCPACGKQHIDTPDEPDAYCVTEADGSCSSKDPRCMHQPSPAPRWTNPPHRSYLCGGCGHIWRPADVPTNGVSAIETSGQNDKALGEAVASTPEPLGFMSPKQVNLIIDPDDESAPYIPMRKTPKGNFTLAVYTSPVKIAREQTLTRSGLPVGAPLVELLGALWSIYNRHDAETMAKARAAIDSYHEWASQC